MSACPDFGHLVVLPHLRVQNANAISSPLIHGFPSMTAFLGLMWALQRKVHAVGLTIRFKAVGVVCHDHQEQSTRGGFVRTFHLSRNPVGKDGGSAPIVEEGRIHLEVSLVFAVDAPEWGQDVDARAGDLATLADLVAGIRIAGGSVLPVAQPWRHRHRPWTLDLSGTAQDRSALFRKARMRLLPGFALVGRDDLLEQRVQDMQRDDPNAGRLEAWLSLARIDWRWSPPQDSDKGGWHNDRTGKGWIVPIPVGYGALGEVQPPGSVANARDATTSFRFVESLYSVGEWISPHRLAEAERLLWYADTRTDTGVYRCRNGYVRAADDASREFVPDFDLS